MTTRTIQAEALPVDLLDRVVGDLGEGRGGGGHAGLARAAGAAMLEPALNKVKSAVSAEDADAFGQAFQTLTATCNACHLAEDVPFIHVAIPAQRTSSIRRRPGSADQEQ